MRQPVRKETGQMNKLLHNLQKDTRLRIPYTRPAPGAQTDPPLPWAEFLPEPPPPSRWRYAVTAAGTVVLAGGIVVLCLSPLQNAGDPSSSSDTTGTFLVTTTPISLPAPTAPETSGTWTETTTQEITSHTGDPGLSPTDAPASTTVPFSGTNPPSDTTISTQTPSTTSPEIQDKGIYTRLNGNLVRFDPDGSKIDLIQDYHGRWINTSYDGYFYSVADGSLSRINLKNGEKFFYPGTDDCYDFTIHNDTVFFMEHDYEMDEMILKRMSLTGQNLQVLDRFPISSDCINLPNGIFYLNGKIFYTSNEKDWTYEIYSIFPDGTNKTKITEYSYHAMPEICMQSDGTLLYYVSNEEFILGQKVYSKIHALNPETREDRIIAELVNPVETPRTLCINGDGFLYAMLGTDFLKISKDGSRDPEMLFSIPFSGQFIGLSETHLFIDAKYNWSYNLKTGFSQRLDIKFK